MTETIINPASPGVRPASAWEILTFSTDTADMPAPPTLSYRLGKVEIAGSGAAVTNTDRRDVFLIPGVTPHRNGWIRSVWWGNPGGAGAGVASTIRPQSGHAHRAGLDEDGRPIAAVCWHDVVFGLDGLFNLNTWRAGAADTTLDQGTGGVLDGLVNVTAAVRAANVVTLTVASHSFKRGDVIQVDVADATYDGVFVVTSVTATTIVYGQVAADDASGGVGTVWPAGSTVNPGNVDALTQQAAVSACSRTNQVATFTVAAGHPFVKGDTVLVDVGVASYDGRWTVVSTTATTVVVHQALANDGAGGAGTITKIFPYLVESRMIENVLSVSARPWRPGTYGIAPGVAALGAEGGDRLCSLAYDLGPIADVPLPTSGRPGLVSAHQCSTTRLPYELVAAGSYD